MKRQDFYTKPSSMEDYDRQQNKFVDDGMSRGADRKELLKQFSMAKGERPTDSEDVVDMSGDIGEGVVESGKVSQEEFDAARAGEGTGAAAGALSALSSMGKNDAPKMDYYRPLGQISTPQIKDVMGARRQALQNILKR